MCYRLYTNYISEGSLKQVLIKCLESDPERCHPISVISERTAIVTNNNNGLVKTLVGNMNWLLLYDSVHDASTLPTLHS